LGRHGRLLTHFQGIAGGPRPSPQSAPAALSAELLRPLGEYEQLLGGGF
jgi:hypothetical protein